MKPFKINKECRLCKSKLKKIISIGPQPLANQFFKKKIFKKYPLNLARCSNCGFFQLKESFNTNFLFSKYNYYSPENNEVTKHHLFIINKIIQNKNITASSKILEVGSNNCTFLDLLKFKFKCFVFGIDPAKNLKSICQSKNIKTESIEFNYKNSLNIKKRYGEFDFIILRHVFAHIDDLKKIIKGLRNLIKKDGTIYIENAYALNTFRNNEFDQIYHEHMSYISIKPLINFFKTEQMYIYDAFKTKIHGGSISIFLTKEKNKKISKKFKTILKEEKILYNEKFINKFVKNTKKNKNAFVKYIKKLSSNKKIIATYGASAKGNTLLNYYGFNDKIIKYAFDNTPIKINKYLPGSGIKVVSSESHLKYKCDYIIVTAWNFLRTIVNKEILFLKNGGKFIVPNPLKIVTIKNYKKFIYKN
jgi:SAM-dependent methyltransferase